ncbi:hypothetical protein J7L13_00085 [bacterium]|nr:hypothetical protein [bacterium]
MGKVLVALVLLGLVGVGVAAAVRPDLIGLSTAPQRVCVAWGWEPYLEGDVHYWSGPTFPQPFTEVRLENGEVVATINMSVLEWYRQQAADNVAVVVVKAEGSGFQAIALFPWDGMAFRETEAWKNSVWYGQAYIVGSEVHVKIDGWRKCSICQEQVAIYQADFSVWINRTISDNPVKDMSPHAGAKLVCTQWRTFTPPPETSTSPGPGGNQSVWPTTTTPALNITTTTAVPPGGNGSQEPPARAVGSIAEAVRAVVNQIIEWLRSLVSRFLT